MLTVLDHVLIISIAGLLISIRICLASASMAQKVPTPPSIDSGLGLRMLFILTRCSPPWFPARALMGTTELAAAQAAPTAKLAPTGRHATTTMHHACVR